MANQTERIGVSYCSLIVARNNWMFREQPIDDIGIDAHMEITETTGEPKQLIALQIKSGASWFEEKKDDCVIFRNINERQYNYWTMNSLPCIVVLYNPDDDIRIWQKLTAETIDRTNDGKGKGFFVRVPLNQIFLNEISNKQLLSFSKETLINVCIFVNDVRPKRRKNNQVQRIVKRPAGVEREGRSEAEERPNEARRAARRGEIIAR